MSVTIKFTISDEQYDELLSRASEDLFSIQDYIRKQLFDGIETFTPRDAAILALKKYSKGETFIVQDLFEGKHCLPNGLAGQFGKKFSGLVKTEFKEQIQFTGYLDTKKQSIYVIL